MSNNKTLVFCPDSTETGRKKVLFIPKGKDSHYDLQNNEWECLGTQGNLTWWKMIKNSPQVKLHDEAFIGYEVEQ
jgi:hypothetical protein